MNSFGRLYRISIFGESHGKSVGILIDGCTPGIKLNEDDFIIDLNRRKAGEFGTTKRIEQDIPQIKSGVFNGYTTGAPILVQFENNNTNSSAYEKIKDIPRPGHSDFTASKKYNEFNDYRGGGHFSGRISLGLVAGGVIAKKMLSSVNLKAVVLDNEKESLKDRIKRAEDLGDSVGAVIECRASDLEIGLGEPFFDSVESNLSHLVFSIPGVKGVEFGDGFSLTKKTGSEVNDLIINKNGVTKTNHSGGINGGITNGNELVFRIAVKPTSSILKTQKTINLKTGGIADLRIEGRHDTCFALRVPVILEAVTAIVLSDFFLIRASGRQ